MTDSERHDRVIEAANLLREHGYAVVPAYMADRMYSAIDQSHELSRKSYDAHLPLLWAMQGLVDAATRALAPSRPVWLRRARSFLHNYHWTEQMQVSGFPTDRDGWKAHARAGESWKAARDRVRPKYREMLRGRDMTSDRDGS
jgi:hypothetical protein